MSSPLLSITDLHKQYAVPVLRGVHLDVQPKQVHALVGANGAGKTTLCRIISGLSQMDSGQMKLQQGLYQPHSVLDAQANGIRIVMQEPQLVDNLSVAENLYFSDLPTRGGLIDFARLFEDSRTTLDEFGLINLDPRQKMAELNIGQRQLIEIARVLRHPCKLLILDEPTAALTDPQIDLLFENLARLKTNGTGVIYVSHRISEFKRIADSISVMKDGKIAGTSVTSDLSEQDIVSLMTSELDQNKRHHSKNLPTDKALSIRGFSNQVLNNIDLDVHYGEVLGIAGLIGSGRTELLRAIFGVDPVDSGYLTLDNQTHRESFRSPADAIHSGIGMIPEDRVRHGLLLEQSITHNMTLASMLSFRQALGWIDKKSEQLSVSAYIQQLSVDQVDSSQSVSELSGGNQQKVIIARWLMKDCKVLLFDEPTRGIDIQTKHAIYQLLHDLAKKGKAIVIVSSETQELTEVCDRIVVLSDGKLTADYNRGDWSAEKIMNASFSAYTDGAYV